MWGCCRRQEEDGQRFREDGEIRRALGREESLVTWVHCGDGSDTGRSDWWLKEVGEI